MRFLLPLVTLLVLTPTALAGLETPLADADRDGNMELGPVCLWGFPEACVLQAYECFQPYRPGLGIACP